jgi:DNA-binding transcriptional LysR family regulator
MDIRYLKTLATVVEVGSFSKAARSLHLTQSAVSQRIKFLEEFYSHILFDRSAATLSLTSAGEIVLESARRIVGIEDSLQGQLKKINGRQKVSLCCTPTFGTVYLSGVLNRFMLESGGSPADLNFLIHNPDQALEGIINREFDISIIEHCPAEDLSKFQTYALPEDELVFVASPKLKSPSSKHDIDSIFDFSIFVRDEGGCSSRQLLIQGLEDQGKSLDDFASVITSDDLRLTCQSILAGGGISFMSKSLVCEYLATGQMVEHHVKGFPRTRERKIVVAQGREKEKLLCDLARCIFNVMDVPSPL